MAISLDQTKVLAFELLAFPEGERREALARKLIVFAKTEAQFIGGLVTHCKNLNLSSEEWFQLLSTFRFRVLRDDIEIMSRLSENQRNKLPPAVFEK